MKQQEDQQSGQNSQESEDQIPAFTEIDKLQAQNINAAVINKLKTAGFQTVLSIVMATKKELLQVKGISDAVIEKLQQAARILEARTSWTTAAVQLQRRQNILRITTGSTKLDELLQGGIESQALTEVFGEFRTGKTQLCHTLCVTAQLSKAQHGGAGKVAYIDTEGTFRPERVAKIAERYGLDPDQVLENILYARAFNSEHQSELITLVAAKMFEENFSLMIVDSVMALFRVDFSGRGELSERQQSLGKLLSKLMKLAEQFNIAVFMTNQVQSDPAGGMTFVPDPKKPIGGNIIAHASTTRLFLRKGKGDNRVCKIYDSPCLPESETTVNFLVFKENFYKVFHQG